jgi:hypothetical protein
MGGTKLIKGNTTSVTKAWFFLFYYKKTTNVANFYGENTLSPSKIVVTNIIFLQLEFLVIYGHQILDFLNFFKVHSISFKLKLINYFESSNKH